MFMPAIAWRYALFYAGAFLTLGTLLPFWPLWLESRGLTAVEIGQLLAVFSWSKVVATPLIGQMSDRSGRSKAALTIVAGASLLCYLAFLPAAGYWPLLILQLLAGIAFQAMIPLGENNTMQAVLRDGLDYGRIRLCGSLAFMAGTLLCGLLLREAGTPWVLYLVIAGLAATLLACLQLPSDIRRRPQGRFWGGFRQLLRLPAFVVFLAAGALLQGSHALYYGFSSLHWQTAGLSATTIGLLWAEGVLAEVLLFAFAGRALATWSTARLLVVAGLCGILRWGVLGSTTALLPLLAAQLLHAGTFGAAHLAAVHYIAKVAQPQGLGGTAQSLYAAVAGGLVSGLLLLASGPLYASLGGAGFFVMAGVSASGLLLTGLFQRLAGGIAAR